MCFVPCFQLVWRSETRRRSWRNAEVLWGALQQPTILIWLAGKWSHDLDELLSPSPRSIPTNQFPLRSLPATTAPDTTVQPPAYYPRLTFQRPGGFQRQTLLVYDIGKLWLLCQVRHVLGIGEMSEHDKAGAGELGSVFQSEVVPGMKPAAFGLCLYIGLLMSKGASCVSLRTVTSYWNLMCQSPF